MCVRACVRARVCACVRACVRTKLVVISLLHSNMMCMVKHYVLSYCLSPIVCSMLHYNTLCDSSALCSLWWWCLCHSGKETTGGVYLRVHYVVHKFSKCMYSV